MLTLPWPTHDCTKKIERSADGLEKKSPQCCDATDKTPIILSSRETVAGSLYSILYSLLAENFASCCSSSMPCEKNRALFFCTFLTRRIELGLSRCSSRYSLQIFWIACVSQKFRFYPKTGLKSNGLGADNQKTINLIQLAISKSNNWNWMTNENLG